MKAVIYEQYGTPDVLKITDVKKPVLRDKEVLVRVRAASINSWDWDMIRGEPIFVRLWGLFKPRYKIPGADIAGTVEAIGKHVTRFKPGDEVFGDLCENGWGGYAEYTSVHENALSLKPHEISFEEAASMPQAGLMAWQCLIEKARLKPGQTVLINGAGGGVGTFAVQIARKIGAEVTAVDATQKHALLNSLGAGHVIDYKALDFAKLGNTYDLVVDVVSNHTLGEYSNCLNRGGTFLMIGGTTPVILQAMLFSRMASKRYHRNLRIFPYAPNSGLEALSDLVLAGNVRPVIDRCYSLDAIREAFQYYASGDVKGKIVITMPV